MIKVNNNRPPADFPPLCAQNRCTIYVKNASFEPHSIQSVTEKSAFALSSSHGWVFVTAGGCWDSGLINWPGSGQAAGSAEHPPGAAPKDCTAADLSTGSFCMFVTHLFVYS